MPRGGNLKSGKKSGLSRATMRALRIQANRDARAAAQKKKLRENAEAVRK